MTSGPMVPDLTGRCVCWLLPTIKVAFLPVSALSFAFIGLVLRSRPPPAPRVGERQGGNTPYYTFCSAKNLCTGRQCALRPSSGVSGWFLSSLPLRGRLVAYAGQCVLPAEH